MAITLKVEPQDFQSAFNEVMVVLDSDKKTEKKFQYIIELSVNGTHTSTLKVQSNPDGYGVFNLGKHLESYVESVIDIADKSTFKRIDSSFTKYSIALKEEYLEQLHEVRQQIDVLQKSKVLKLNPSLIS